MRDIVSELKAAPSLILVLYSSNDVANDFAHPHSTVVDGWQVNNIWLSVDTGIAERVEIDRAFINATIRKNLAKSGAKRRSNRFLRLLYRYSATSHIIAALLHSTGRNTQIRSITFKGRRVVDLYWLTDKYATGEQVVYRNNPAAERNKQAIRQFRNFAAIVDAKILFVLIPPKKQLKNLNFYVEVKRFLEAEGIQYLDLNVKYHRLDLKPSDLFWTNDPHFKPNGNEITAGIVNAYIEQYGF